MSSLDKQIKRVDQLKKLVGFLKSCKKDIQKNAEDITLVSGLIKYWEEQLYWQNQHCNAMIEERSLAND